MTGDGGRRGRARGENFDAFVLGFGPRLLRTAVLLVGDRHDGEDLLQEVLGRVYVTWPRVDEPLPYAHRALTHAAMNRWRRRRRHPEVPLDRYDIQTPDPTTATVERDRLLRALAVLPAGQRAVVVLRYYDDLTEAQIAAAMGCSPGTVKSQASRALTRLRQLLAAEDHHPATPRRDRDD